MKWTKRELARLRGPQAADLPKSGELQGRQRTAEEIAALEAARTERINKQIRRKPLNTRQAADLKDRA